VFDTAHDNAHWTSRTSVSNSLFPVPRQYRRRAKIIDEGEALHPPRDLRRGDTLRWPGSDVKLTVAAILGKEE
jgi:hypothetical protein